MKIISTSLIFSLACLNATAQLPSNKIEGDSCISYSVGNVKSAYSYYCDKEKFSQSSITISELYLLGWQVVAMTALGTSGVLIVIERERVKK